MASRAVVSRLPQIGVELRVVLRGGGAARGRLLDLDDLGVIIQAAEGTGYTRRLFPWAAVLSIDWEDEPE